jgi:alkylhydroperoxidase family enzyme
MEAYLDKVRHRAYRVTDDDVDAVRKTYTEDEIFEATVSVAMAAGLERLDAALAALERAR